MEPGCPRAVLASSKTDCPGSFLGQISSEDRGLYLPTERRSGLTHQPKSCMLSGSNGGLSQGASEGEAGAVGRGFNLIFVRQLSRHTCSGWGSFHASRVADGDNTPMCHKLKQGLDCRSEWGKLMLYLSSQPEACSLIRANRYSNPTVLGKRYQSVQRASCNNYPLPESFRARLPA